MVRYEIIHHRQEQENGRHGGMRKYLRVCQQMNEKRF
jgi:hypothetical protein